MSERENKAGKRIRDRLAEVSDQELWLVAVELKELFWMLEKSRQTHRTFRLMDSIKKNLSALWDT